MSPRTRLSRRDMKPADRISDLPEAIITEILNLVPIKDAAATSVLSKSWRYCWKEVTTFDMEAPLGPRHCSYSHMKQFVDRHFPSTNFHSTRKFRFKLPEDVATGLQLYFGQAAVSAVSRGAVKLKVLDLAFPTESIVAVKLPAGIYSCKTLEVLKLSGKFKVKLPDVVCLPMLVELELNAVEYKSDETISELISSCPILQSLKVNFRRNTRYRSLTISSPTLKRLQISCFGVCRSKPKYKKEVRIHAQTLEYLKLQESVSYDISIHGLSSVNEVDLFIYHPLKPDSIVGLLESLHSVKFLKLSGSIMAALDSATKELSASFERLTKLVVNNCNLSNESNRLVDLIDRCVNLQVLKINCSSSSPGWSPVVIPRCLSSNLKTLEATFEPGSMFELNLEMMEFFLSHGLVLERVNLCFQFNDLEGHISYSKMDKILKEVLMMPRASPTCKFFRRIGDSGALEPACLSERRRRMRACKVLTAVPRIYRNH